MLLYLSSHALNSSSVEVSVWILCHSEAENLLTTGMAGDIDSHLNPLPTMGSLNCSIIGQAFFFRSRNLLRLSWARLSDAFLLSMMFFYAVEVYVLTAFLAGKLSFVAFDFSFDGFDVLEF